MKSFVELHGGRVELQSVLREGATLTCFLPAKQIAMESLAAGGVNASAGANDGFDEWLLSARNRMDVECYLGDPSATEAAAAALARRCRVGDIFCLYGDLGAGKTAFARGFLRALGVAGEIPSPTFNLLLTYDTPSGPVWHFDLYRLNRPEEAEELGLDEAFADGISLIEWPERLGSWLPEQRIEIHLADADDGAARHLRLHALGAGAERWRDPW